MSTSTTPSTTDPRGLYAALRARAQEGLTAHSATFAEAQKLAEDWMAAQTGPAVVVHEAAVLACGKDPVKLWRLFYRELPFRLLQPGGVPGTVYLICFDRPYRHAKHYVGWDSAYPQRIQQHRAGNGGRLMSVIDQAGIGWEVTATWQDADRYYERLLKYRRCAPRICPRCSPGNHRGIPPTWAWAATTLNGRNHVI